MPATHNASTKFRAALRNELPYRVALAGRFRYGLIRYGIENFYIDERQRETIAEELRKHPDQVRIEVKVDRTGNVALKRMLVQDRVYE